MLIISSAFVYTQKVKDAPNERSAEDRGKVKEIGTVSLWNKWKEDAVCQRSTRGGLESPRCATDLAHLDPLILLTNSKWSTACAWVALCDWKVVSTITEKTECAASTSHNNALRRKMTKLLWKVLVSVVNTLQKSTNHPCQNQDWLII